MKLCYKSDLYPHASPFPLSSVPLFFFSSIFSFLCYSFSLSFPFFLCSFVPLLQCSYFSLFLCSCVHLFLCSCVPVFICFSVPVFLCSSIILFFCLSLLLCSLYLRFPVFLHLIFRVPSTLPLHVFPASCIPLSRSIVISFLYSHIFRDTIPYFDHSLVFPFPLLS